LHSVFRGCGSTHPAGYEESYYDLTYHKDKINAKVNKANKGETKPVVVYDYNQNMTAIHLRDQMLQPYLLE
jgi:hypothetical protein